MDSQHGRGQGERKEWLQKWSKGGGTWGVNTCQQHFLISSENEKEI
jgi:hypothetical protein